MLYYYYFHAIARAHITSAYYCESKHEARALQKKESHAITHIMLLLRTYMVVIHIMLIIICYDGYTAHYFH
jgi:hypothetical protein